MTAIGSNDRFRPERTPRSGAGVNGDQRIAGTPVGKYERADIAEACLLAIKPDKGGLTFHVEMAPDRHSFRGEAPVGVAGHDYATGTQQAPQLAENRDRALQVLDPDADEDGIEGGVGLGKDRVAIEVLDEPPAKPWIGCELFGVHAVPDDV